MRLGRAAVVAGALALGFAACNELIGAGAPIVVRPDLDPCQANADCQSGICGASGLCISAACVLENVELCGEGCVPCADGEPCDADADCASGVCGESGVCASATCPLGVCGALCPTTCDDGEPCAVGADCKSGTCDTQHGDVCVPATCDGGTAFLCGGMVCAKCGSNETCTTDADCQSMSCKASRCIPASCGNGMMDGDEEGMDCGGSCFVECTPCFANADCDAMEDCCDDDDLGCCAPPNTCCTDGNCVCRPMTI